MLSKFLKDNSDGSKECCEDMYVVRTDRAGVFYGKISSLNEENRRCVMKDARRIWFWSGAASLSQLSLDGVKNPSECKIPEAVSEVVLYDVIEILPMTKKSVKSLDGVPEWKA